MAAELTNPLSGLPSPGAITFPHRELDLKKVGELSSQNSAIQQLDIDAKLNKVDTRSPSSLDEDINFKNLGFYRKGLGFSGCDISATIRLPQYLDSKGQPINDTLVFHIGTLQTLSISTYESKTPLKAIGFKNPIAVARGGRTIAGTLIFNQLHTHVFNDNPAYIDSTINADKFITDANGFITYASGNAKLFTDTEKPEDKKKYRRLNWDFSWDKGTFGDNIKASELPPFDIIINFLNEKGNTAKIILYGVELVHESQTLSVEDIYTEVQYQYVARDIEHFNNSLERSKHVNAYLSDRVSYEPFDIFRGFNEPEEIEEEPISPAASATAESPTPSPPETTAAPSGTETTGTNSDAPAATIPVAPELPPVGAPVRSTLYTFPPGPAPVTLVSNTDRVKVRSNPGTDKPPVPGKFIKNNGPTFQALGFIYNGAEYLGPTGVKSTIWVKVDLGNGQDGWVAGTFTTFTFPPQASP